MNIAMTLPVNAMHELARSLVRAPESEVRIKLSYIRLLSVIADKYRKPTVSPSMRGE